MLTVITNLSDLTTLGLIVGGGVGMMYVPDGPLVGRVLFKATPGVVYKLTDNPNARLLSGFTGTYSNSVAVGIE